MSRLVSRLAEVAIGSRGRVVEVDGGDAIGIRLLEMGLTPGVELSVLGTAPLGDPMEIEVRGYRLSLRKSEAARISVEVLPGA
ncbi:MAG: iron transporter [Planctomycetota bacterium]|nr:MAG: iron transporter [Planctomycetota bacterium]REJ86663.1 MAG: iron transporter [Planctomycetota bacterium]REK27164.1 MAG: iron transporter [Planctomycetota bacterium]REK37839.1 MAG: iron transporter [Planctomycetota bacterium]